MKFTLAILIMAIAILAPGFYFGFGIPTLHVEDAIILLSALLIFFAPDGGTQFLMPRAIPVIKPYYIMLLYILVITLVFHQTIDGSTGLLMASLFAVLGMFKPVLLLAVVYALLNNEKQIRWVGTFLISIIFFEFVMMVLQQDNYFGINSWLTPMYRSAETDIIYLVGSRVYGTLGNPNDMGTALGLLGCLAYAKALFARSLTGRVVSALAVVLAMIGCIWYAKTRQGTFCLLAGLAVVQILALVFSRQRAGALVFLALGVVGLTSMIGVVAMTPELGERFAVLTGQEGITEDSSIIGRLVLWPSFLAKYAVWVLTGKGMTSFITDVVWDSGYISILILGGIPALLCLMVIVFRPLVDGIKFLRHDNGDNAWLVAGAAATWLPFLLANIVNNTINNQRIMTLEVLIIFLPYAAYAKQAVLLPDEELLYDYQPGLDAV